jgi:hypothetical protein
MIQHSVIEPYDLAATLRAHQHRSILVRGHAV